MARVNVEQKALSDPRYAVLGNLLGTSRHDALGRMIFVWNECQERERQTLSETVVAAIFERDDAADLLVLSELAVRDYPGGGKPVGAGLIRVCGCAGRTDWLKKRRQDGRKGGKLGGRPPKPIGVSKKHPAETPLTPAPALTEQIQTPIRPPKRGAGRVPKYPPGFSDCYAAYPHFENRTKKAEAGKVWKRLQLEKLNGQVMHWIEAAKQTESWTKDAGQFVPGMQTWLKGQDFSDPPPTPQPSAMDEIRQREHDRHRREFDERNRQTAARKDQA